MTLQSMKSPVRATTDMVQAKADYDLHGYCLIENALSAEENEAVRQRISAQAQAEKALGWAREDCGPDQVAQLYGDQLGAQRSYMAGGVNQRVAFLVNKGKVLRDLVTHPVAIEMMEHALGRHFLLSSYSANIVKGGCVEQGLHRDNWWSPLPYNRGEPFRKVGETQRYDLADGAQKAEADQVLVPACAANVIWMVTDFTEENGATRLVPGTHLVNRNPDSSIPHKIPTVAAEGKAGTAMVFDGRLWHASGRSTAAEGRIGLLAYYCGPQFRQLHNYFIGLDPKVLDEASDRLLELLGYTTWMSDGVADHLSSRERLRAREPFIPELNLGDIPKV